jgi:Flp pilus assembly pilin Flp
VSDSSGQTVIEYGLILAVVSLILLASLLTTATDVMATVTGIIQAGLP